RAPALGLRVSCHPCGLVSDAKTAVAALPFCRGHSRNSCRPGALAGLPPERSRFFGDSRFGSRACAALNPGGRPAALPSAEQPWLQHRRPAAYAAGFHAGPDEPHSVSLRRPALLLLLRGVFLSDALRPAPAASAAPPPEPRRGGRLFRAVCNLFLPAPLHFGLPVQPPSPPSPSPPAPFPPPTPSR